MSQNSFNSILSEYESYRDRELLELERRKDEIYKKFPRIKEIDDLIAKLSLEITKSILNNSNDTQKLIYELEQKFIDLKMEKGEILAVNNYPTDYLTIKHRCKLCNDTGFVNNTKCNCLKQKLIDRAYKESNLSNLLNDQNFNNFNFEYYSTVIDENRGVSPQKNMQSIYQSCIKFVDNFDKVDENLLFTGSTGLGKTFLSSCIAKDLLDKGKTVFYQTSFKIFELLEEYQFSNNKSSFNKDKINILMDCDLLIIDDLGSEFINSYTVSEFFNILNSRLLEKKKTIISTNLDMSSLFDHYSARVASRIMGNYTVLEFFGDDIRKKIGMNL